MTNVELFKASNLKFFSIHQGVVGSLYFRGVDRKDGHKVFYCGRIRLCHDDGPVIENKAVAKWLLLEADEAQVYRIYDALDEGIHTGNYDHYFTLLDALKIYADVTKIESLIPAVSKSIFERHLFLDGYEGIHPSRGVLEFKDGHHQISDEQLKAIMKVINPTEKVDVQNKKLKDLISQLDIDWLHQ